jgi:hypothetical protein
MNKIFSLFQKKCRTEHACIALTAAMVSAATRMLEQYRCCDHPEHLCAGPELITFIKLYCDLMSFFQMDAGHHPHESNIAQREFHGLSDALGNLVSVAARLHCEVHRMLASTRRTNSSASIVLEAPIEHLLIVKSAIEATIGDKASDVVWRKTNNLFLNSYYQALGGQNENL